MSNKGTMVTMQLILVTAGRAPRCSELLVSHGEPLRLQRFGETQFGLHELGQLGPLDDVAMTDFSPAMNPARIGRIRPRCHVLHVLLSSGTK